MFSFCVSASIYALSYKNTYMQVKVDWTNPINIPGNKNTLLVFRVLVGKQVFVLYSCCEHKQLRIFQSNLNLCCVNLLGLFAQRGKPGISRGHGSAGETSVCQRPVFYLFPNPSLPKNHKAQAAGASE